MFELLRAFYKIKNMGLLKVSCKALRGRIEHEQCRDDVSWLYACINGCGTVVRRGLAHIILLYIYTGILKKYTARTDYMTCTFRLVFYVYTI